MKNYLFKRGNILPLLLLLCIAGMTNVSQAQSAWEQSQNYLFYLVYADYQVNEQLMPQREGSQYDAIRRNLLPRKEDQGTQVGLWGDDPNLSTLKSGLIGLAQNEKEGFQVFFREQEKERNLRIEVSPFLNSQNEVLQHAVYYEEFFWPEGVWAENNPNADSLAEALVPYTNEIKRTSVGHNKVFYVELKSTKDQTPGEYTSTVIAYDGNDTIDTRTVIAKVWNFALPDSHYSEVVMGLYNRNSGYWTTSSLFTLNGIPVDNNGNVADEHLDEAKQILNGYHECLLEHGVSTYELPRWLMEEDPKKAELAMADPRRKVFEVPVHWRDLSGSSFNESGQSVLNQYKDIVYNNVFLKDKAFFYPMDEPDWSDQETVNTFNTVCSALSESWPGYHAVIPFYSEYFTTVQGFEGKIDILCPNQGAFDPNGGGYFWAEERLQDFKTRSHTWRYQGDGQCGGLYCFIHAIAPVGTMRRILFWQQCAINSDGFLNWNCALLPHDWTKKQLPVGGYTNNVYQTGNGDGILLYPGTMFGQDANTPVVSLRLKQLAEGIDDYDYLRLANEFLDENDENGMNASLQRVFWNYPNLAYLCYIINRQMHPEWESYYAGNCKWMNQARHLMGEALSAANTEHEWGEWMTAVFPDETHNGLEIRTCSHCGAQESREKTFQISMQEITLASGWNWFSTNVEITMDDLKAALQAAYPNAGTNALVIKSKSNGQTSWNGTAQMWMGGLSAIDLSQMYKVKVPTSSEITLQGIPINPADHPATIVPGANWIAFPLSESMSVTDAFVGFPANGDIVKVKGGGQATWNSTTGQWMGGLNTLEPGKGYIYNSKATENKNFVFPIIAK